MAESSIQLPADGAGKEVQTYTQSGGEHREAVVIGDPTDAYVATVNANGELLVSAGADSKSADILTTDGGGAGIHTSTGNSFDSADLPDGGDLLAGETLRGAWEDLNDYWGVLITITNEQDSAVGSVQYSSDGTDAGLIRTTAVLVSAAPNGQVFHVVKQGRYFRVNYVQGATDGTIKINTTKLSTAPVGSISPVGTPLTDAQIVLQTKAVLTGKTSSGVYVNVGADDGGAIFTEDFLRAVGRGEISGHSLITKFGYNPNAGTGASDVIYAATTWAGDPVGVTQTVDVWSTSTADTSSGTGARTVRIVGLDGSGVAQEETITLNGTTHVVSSNTWSTVNRAWVLTAGSGGQNAGTINITHTTTTANVFATIPIGFNQSQAAAYRVPAATTGWLIGYAVSMARTNGAAGSALVSLRTRESGSVYRARRVHQITNALAFDRTLEGGIQLPALTDVKLRVGSTSNAGTLVTGQFQILLIDD